MSDKQTLPYGSWPSKITAESTGDLREFSELSWSGDGRLLWVERYSNHSSLMAWDARNGEIKNISGELNIGGGIMYGGGSYTVCRDQIVFIEKGSNQLYHVAGLDSESVPIGSSPHRKSSPRISPFGTNLVYIESDGENDSIKMIDYTSVQRTQTIDSKFDFYNYLRWHPDGNQLIWMSWSHTKMPWEEANIILAQIDFFRDDFLLLHPRTFVTLNNYCDLQPEISPDGNFLSYVSDKTGWWQIYLFQEDPSETLQLTPFPEDQSQRSWIQRQSGHGFNPNLRHKNYISNQVGSSERLQLTTFPADHALPPWLQNQSSYGFSPDSQRIYCIRNQLGFASLWQLDLIYQAENQIHLNPEYTWLESLAVSPVKDQIALVASGGRTPPEIIVTFPWGDQRVIRRSAPTKTDPTLFSRPEAISWPDKQRNTVHGLFYEPQNPEFETEGKPPLLIIIHSGPTRQKYAEFQPRTQYFTSRGFAVLEINYRGSTGYGRDYWQALKGQWGVLDVQDVYRAAKVLSRRGLVDKKRIALLGSSSGGLTVLQLLVKYPRFFRAGISLYGIANLIELVKTPPKFERYYNHWLIGDPEEASANYRSRSPLYSAQKIRTPVAIFHGGKDSIVPRGQAEQIVTALKKNNVPHEYYLYPEESHGFKKSKNVVDFYNKAEAFLIKYVVKSSS